ncbi:hypothetical protein RRG08_061783, partial [Elysia crispata]
MSVLVVQICSYGPVRRHDLCQSLWSKSVLTALSDVMSHVSPRGPHLFLRPCQTSCLMSVLVVQSVLTGLFGVMTYVSLVVQICSYGPDRRRVSCQSSWSTSVLTALSDVMSHVSPRGPNLFLRSCSTSRLMSVLVVQICSYGPVRRHDLCQSSWSKSVLTALSDVMSHVSPRGPNLFLRPCQTSCLMSVLVVQICSYGPVRRNDHVSLRGPNLFLRPCQTSCLMSVLVVQICSHGPVRRHDLCQSSWSTSVLTAHSDVMSHVSPRGPHLFLRPCQTSCLMSVLVVHICSYGPVRRHVSCQSSWSTSVLTALSDVMSHVNPRGPHLFLRPCQTSCLMSVLVVQICSYGPVRRHVSCQSSWSKSVLTALSDVTSHVSPRGPNLFLRPLSDVMSHVSPRGPNLFLRPCQTSCLMSVLVVHICSYGPVRRHVSCQSSWSTSVLTALSDVMSHVSPRGPHLFLRPCQTSCLMSVLVVHICSYGPVRRHVSCQSSWSTSVLTALSDVMSHVSPRGPHLFFTALWRQTSCLMSVLLWAGGRSVSAFKFTTQASLERRIKSLRKTKYRTGQPFGQFTSLPYTVTS